MVEHGGGVVVEAGGAALEEAGDEGDLVFADDGGEALRAGAGDGLGEVEEGVVLTLAEVLGAEELGQADELGAGAGCLLDQRGSVVEVLRGGGGAGHLDECDAG